MPTTRSASGLSALPKETAAANAKAKRKAASESPSKSQKKVRVAAELPQTIPPGTASLVPNGTDTTPLVPAVLSFDFEKAREHLISVDERFKDVFEKRTCSPFEELEQVHPFRALATSILGQQISWMAARAINHKFIRLYNQSIPENYADYTEGDSFFPSPQQVAVTDLTSLRSAGLSGRKAEYIRDLAMRFSDGRLSTEKLLEANDEELSEMLIEIYGVGKWTVDMFSIFSMRRPNILPVADMGVQRGVVRWFLSLHSPSYKIRISSKECESQEDKKADTEITPKTKAKGRGKKPNAKAEEDALPVLSSVPPGPASGSMADGALAEIASMPTSSAPSTNKIFQKGSKLPTPLPDGMTVATLRSRLDPSKRGKKGIILTPKEMEDLTEPWKPYRSLAVYYMWALAEDK
jgi:DNA-3-methyladenine glycosylase II